jgi:hypothetical protein
MAEAFPCSRFAGFDFSDAGIAAARLEAERKGLTNARFDKRDAAYLGEVGRFDFITTFTRSGRSCIPSHACTA